MRKKTALAIHAQEMGSTLFVVIQKKQISKSLEELPETVRN